MAISRSREVARTSSNPARFAQAIKSTNATAVIRIQSGCFHVTGYVLNQRHRRHREIELRVRDSPVLPGHLAAHEFEVRTRLAERESWLESADHFEP